MPHEPGEPLQHLVISRDSAWTEGSCPQPQQGAAAACAPQPGGPRLVTQLRGHHQKSKGSRCSGWGLPKLRGNCVRRGWGGRTCFHNCQTPQNQQKGDGCDPFRAGSVSCHLLDNTQSNTVLLVATHTRYCTASFVQQPGEAAALAPAGCQNLSVKLRVQPNLELGRTWTTTTFHQTGLALGWLLLPFKSLEASPASSSPDSLAAFSEPFS